MKTSKTSEFRAPRFGLLYRLAFRWSPFWFYNIVVLGSAYLPGDRIPHFFVYTNDKIVHGAEYFLLFFLAVNAFKRAIERWVRRNALNHAFFYCLLMGAVTEIGQLYIPRRSCDIKDWTADALGAAAGWMFLKLAGKKRIR